MPGPFDGQRDMMDTLSSRGYLHWLILAGMFLLIAGFVGLEARKRVAEAEINDTTSGQRPSEPEAEFTQSDDNRRSTLEERSRDRSTDRDHDTDNFPPNEPKVHDKDST